MQGSGLPAEPGWLRVSRPDAAVACPPFSGEPVSGGNAGLDAGQLASDPLEELGVYRGASDRQGPQAAQVPAVSASTSASTSAKGKLGVAGCEKAPGQRSGQNN